MKRLVLLCLLGIFFANSVLAGQVVAFRHQPPDLIQSISRDGRLALWQNHRFDAKTGRMPIIPLPAGRVDGRYNVMSGNGQSLIGEFFDDNFESDGFIRTNGAYSMLDHMFGPFATPLASSDDGRKIIGTIWNEDYIVFWVWWVDGQITGPDGIFHVLSGDGKIVFGWSDSYVLTYWDGMNPTEITDPLWQDSQFTAVSHTGHAVVGYKGNSAFRWVKGVGFEDLGHLPLPGDLKTIPTAITAGGQVVTGYTTSNGRLHAFIKEGANPLRHLADFLSERAIDVTGWEFRSAMISQNGEAIVGTGTYNGQDRGYHVWIGGSHISVDVKAEGVRGGKTFQATVALSEPSPVGRRVNLSSSKPGISVPAAVWIPANANSVTFTGSVALGTVAGDHAINAVYGDLSASADVPVRSMIVKFDFAPNKIHSGIPATARVTLSGPSPTPVIVNLQYTSELFPPNYFVTVPPMASTYDFPVRAEEYGGYYNAFMDASTSGEGVYEQRRAHVAVYSILKNFTVSPNPIPGGTQATGRITAQLAAPASGLTYRLRSLTQLLSVPATAVMIPGSTSVEFPVTSYAVTQTAVRTIEARIGAVSKTCSVTIIP